MKNQMKRFVAMLLASLAILALAGCSNSGNGDGDKADYPKENITVIVPYSAGGPTDMSVRALLDAASKYLPSGVSFMPENQTGAGGLIGMSATAASDNDGYTLGPIAVDLLMMKYEGKTQLGLDSFVPLAATMADPYGLLVAANNGKYDSVEEFVAYCKAHWLPPWLTPTACWLPPTTASMTPWRSSWLTARPIPVRSPWATPAWALPPIWLPSLSSVTSASP